MSSETTLAVTNYAQQFSSTPRGARLARLAAVCQLTSWGWPHTGEPSGTAALLVAELASNAVRHGRVPGRDFLLSLTVTTPPDAPAVLRIEVSDSRGERLPEPPADGPDPCSESGRGLLLVAELAARWGSVPRHPSGKTVWCEILLEEDVPASAARPSTDE